MTIQEAIRQAQENICFVIRRKCWLETATPIEVGADEFWDFAEDKAVKYYLTPSEVLADDWEIVDIGEDDD